MYERMLDLSEEPAYEEMTAHCGKAGALKHICDVFPEKGALVLMLAERRIHPAKKK